MMTDLVERERQLFLFRFAGFAGAENHRRRFYAVVNRADNYWS